MVRLTPYEVFAIADAAAGILAIEEVGRLQVSYTAGVVLVAFLVLPALGPPGIELVGIYALP